MKLYVVLSLLILTGTLLFAGCIGFEGSQSNPKTKEAFSLDSGYVSEEYAYSPSPDVKNAPSSSYGGEIPLEQSLHEQKIIRTANIRLEVKNVTFSTGEVQEIAKKFDGLVQSSSVQATSKNRYSGTVTIRIPAEHFDLAISEISAIGIILSSSVNAEDVTEEYVDLQAQRDALSYQLDQYNRLLTKGQNVSEILEVQKEIERVQVELDRIVGKMKYLDNRISLSTITVGLSEPAQLETPGGYSLPSVISEGIAGFVNTVVWLFIAILTILPLVLVGGAGYVLYKRWKIGKTE